MNLSFASKQKDTMPSVILPSFRLTFTNLGPNVFYIALVNASGGSEKAKQQKSSQHIHTVNDNILYIHVAAIM